MSINVIKTIFFIAIICFSRQSFGQIGIGTNTPDIKAALDIESLDKGILIPRLHDTIIQTMVTPPSGLLVYNSVFAKFQYYDGFEWKDIKAESGISENIMIINTDGDVSVNTEENLVEKRITMRAATEQVMSIDTQVANIAPPLTLGDNPYAMAKARLDVDGRIKISDDLISSPESGMIRWNSDEEDFEGYNGSNWKSFTGQTSLPQFGKPYLNTFPNHTDIGIGSSHTTYYGANINAKGNNLVRTFYDTINTQTTIIIDRPADIQSLIVDGTLYNPNYNHSDIGQNWFAYKDGDDLLTWQYNGIDYVEQDSIQFNYSSFDFVFVGDDKIVTILDDSFVAFLRLYEFDNNTGNWVSIASNIIPGVSHSIMASGDTILLLNHEVNKLTSYDVSNDLLTELDSYTNPENILDADIYDNRVMLVDEVGALIPTIRIRSKHVNNLSNTYNTTFIALPYIGEDPIVRVKFYKDILAIGIQNEYNNQSVQCGKVILYRYKDLTLTYLGELSPSYAQDGMKFGATISIDDNHIRVGAPIMNIGTMNKHGAIFTFDRQD